MGTHVNEWNMPKVHINHINRNKINNQLCSVWCSTHLNRWTESVFINRFDDVDTTLKEKKSFDIMAIELMHTVGAVFLGEPSRYKQPIR